MSPDLDALTEIVNELMQMHYPSCSYKQATWTPFDQYLRITYCVHKDLEFIIGLNSNKSWCVYSHDYDTFNLIEMPPCSDPSFMRVLVGALRQQQHNLAEGVYHSC